MGNKDIPVEVVIEEVNESRPAVSGSGVVIDTQAVVDGERRDALIEVAQEDAATVAVALMNTATTPELPPEDKAALPAALRCLAAGVIHVHHPDGVRLHLQMDSGQVLPLEMSDAAVEALVRALNQHLLSRRAG